MQPGDSLTIDWQPCEGTVILVNGKQEGAPIKAPEFYLALMSIWLGKAHADEQLKEVLLGKAITAPGSGNHNN